MCFLEWSLCCAIGCIVIFITCPIAFHIVLVAVTTGFMIGKIFANHTWPALLFLPHQVGLPSPLCVGFIQDIFLYYSLILNLLCSLQGILKWWPVGQISLADKCFILLYVSGPQWSVIKYN